MRSEKTRVISSPSTNHQPLTLNCHLHQSNNHRLIIDALCHDAQVGLVVDPKYSEIQLEIAET